MVRSFVGVCTIFKDPAIAVSHHMESSQDFFAANVTHLTTGWRGAGQKSSKIKDGFGIIIIGGFFVTQFWLDHAGDYIKVSHLASSRNPSER